MDSAFLGDSSYDEHDYGAKWWYRRARDPIHRRAYRSIAEYGARFVPAEPRLIIDYGCGPGLLARELARRFPSALILGIDESAGMIEAAHEVIATSRLGPLKEHCEFLRMALPDFHVDLPKADAVFFSFPDFRFASERKAAARWRDFFPEDWRHTVALRKRLAREADGYQPNPRDRIFLERVAGRNLRHLVKRGGHIVRVDYGNANRAQCDDVCVAQMAWCEGSLAPPDAAPKERRQLVFTRLEASRYVPSRVMRDVYAQTGDRDDREGGHLTSVLRAL